ncbi:MAG TPA: hypothetical protein VJS92_03735 [Candidatus Polarisedimenticolaceae bacterium]|nr:hypothetical protein [Candidatus Polarisedimenticolaceae bacterium]
MAKRAALLLLLLLLLLLGAACGGRSAEEEIRERLQRVGGAVTGKDLATVEEFISERYADGRGNDKQALTALLAAHFAESRSLYLWTKVQRLELTDSGAEVTVFAAMAEQPIEKPALDADFQRVDLVLVEEGAADWKLLRADWRRARLGDLR